MIYSLGNYLNFFDMLKKEFAFWLSSSLLLSLAPVTLISNSSVAGNLGSCPIPETDARNPTDLNNIISSFANSDCAPITLAQDTEFFRYYSFPVAPAVSRGRFLTSTLYTDTADAIIGLALLPDFNNKATQLEKALVPAGTTVYQGLAGAQPVGNTVSCYKGGAVQDFIADRDVVKTVFTYLSNLVNNGDSCTYAVPEPNLAPVISLIGLGFIGYRLKKAKA